MHNPPSPAGKLAIYRSLQKYVGWSAADVENVKLAGTIVRPEFNALIDDFYNAIQAEPVTAQLITGGDEQIARLKRTLLQWLEECFLGIYDEAYVMRRWQVGFRHVSIGLRQIYADAAIARLRGGLHEALERNWPHDPKRMPAIARSINRLLDLELALIEDAYTAEQLIVQEQNVKLQSENTFRRLVEAARCIIVIVRKDYSVAYFSPFAEQLTQFNAADVIGSDYLARFLDPHDQEDVAKNLQSIFALGVPSLGLEHPIVCKGGEKRSIMWNAQRLDNYEGAAAVLAVGHDITDLKQAQDKVLQSERLAAIGQTVTGLAHESRNAFQRSQACLEMLGLELSGQPDKLELVQRIQRALDHLHHLYEEVRDYAAPIAVDHQPCNVAHVWRDAWGHLDVSRRQKDIKLIEEPCRCDLTADIDWFKMGQVFRNILENALAACPEEEGEIHISVAPAKLEQRAALQISVRDNGPGIPFANRARIFDPFYTTKAKGTGLGMAIAKRIVEAHGGTIQIAGKRSPTKQTGAEFVVTIPRNLDE